MVKVWMDLLFGMVEGYDKVSVEDRIYVTGEREREKRE